jgi:hypothetical protein
MWSSGYLVLALNFDEFTFEYCIRANVFAAIHKTEGAGLRLPLDLHPPLKS